MAKNDLKYIDFRTASYRNLNVCKELIERLDVKSFGIRTFDAQETY